jgi:hypothetical protein
MFEQHRHAPAGVYALADSLDAILAMCEDLQSTARGPICLSHLDHRVIAIVLQARRRISEFDPLQHELLHGCAQFLVATTGLAINRSDDLQPATPEISQPIADDHLIGGSVRLGVLAQLAGNLLDILEAHYVLYDDEQHKENESIIGGIAPAERRSHAL